MNLNFCIQNFETSINKKYEIYFFILVIVKYESNELKT